MKTIKGLIKELDYEFGGAIKLDAIEKILNIGYAHACDKEANGNYDKGYDEGYYGGYNKGHKDGCDFGLDKGYKIGRGYIKVNARRTTK